MVSEVNENILCTGNEAELQKTSVPPFLIGLSIPQEVKQDRYKDNWEAMQLLWVSFQVMLPIG